MLIITQLKWNYYCVNSYEEAAQEILALRLELTGYGVLQITGTAFLARTCANLHPRGRPGFGFLIGEGT